MGRWRLLTFDDDSSAWCGERLEYYLKKIGYWQPIEHVLLKPYGGRDRSLAQRKDWDRGIARPWLEQSFVVVFDEKGQNWDSLRWAKEIPRWAQQPQVCFIVGPAYGLDRRWLSRADKTLALSPLTLNHELAQVLVAEQLYRAWSIEKNWPYHQD